MLETHCLKVERYYSVKREHMYINNSSSSLLGVPLNLKFSSKMHTPLYMK